MIIHTGGYIKKSLLLLVLLVSFFAESRAQDCSIPIIVDLRASPNMSQSFKTKRNGDCCGDKSCVTFKIYLHPGSDLLSFATDKITGAGFYSIDCGSLIPSGTAACLSKASDIVIITYCKPGGGDEETYTIKTSTEVSASSDINLRQGCTGEMSVNGLQPANITWTSIYPGVQGQYNSYLSCTSGCSKTYVTPLPGAPAYIDYRVSGPGAACAGTKTDTIRVYTSPPLTVAIDPANPAICSDGSGSTVLTAVTTGGIPPFTYLWSDGQNTPSITVNTAGNYSVTVTDNTINCSPVSQSTEVAAIPTPAAPAVEGITICSGNTVTLTATSPGGTYQWFNSASGGTLLSTGDSFTTPVLITATTYYVQTTVNGCTSQRTPVTVNVTPVPTAPVAQGMTICSNNAVTLSATSPGGFYQWFDSASGGILLGTGTAFTTPVLTATTSYYVQTTVNDCTSPRTRVTVTVKPVPAAPTAAGGSICSGSSAKLTATAPGGNYAWFSASEGGVLLATTPDLFTPILTSTTTYYVQTTINGCTSARSPVTVIVNPIPQAPTVADLTICQYSSATFHVMDAGETYRWYDAPEGGNLLSTGSSFTTPPLSNTTTYYVDATSGSGCTGIRTTVTANVNYPKNPAFVYSSGTYCVSGIDPTPAIIGGETGTFSADPGLVFMNPKTGEIDLSASQPGLYEVKFVADNPCAYMSTVSLTITNAPDASFSYSSSYCRKQSNAIPVFLPGSSAGTFSALPAGLVFLNASTGEIDLNVSAAGTYTITNLIAAAGGCSEASFSQTVTINPESIADAGPDQTICSGSSVILNGQIGGGATSGKWSGGLGTFSDPFALNAVYTPAAGETSVYLTLTADTGPCDGQNNTMHITIEPTPVITSSTSLTICNDEPLQYTITSSVSGTTFTWSRTLVSGIDNTAITGQTSGVINEVLHNSTPYPVVVKYEITPVAGGCTGDVFIYQVTVNPTPTVTSNASATVCNDELQNYAITGGVGNTTFIWSRAEVAGISNPAVSGQASDKIAEILHNTTFYPLVVRYEIISMANGCAGETFLYEVTVNPSPVVSSASSGTVCNDQPQNYTITGNVSSTTFKWSRAATPGISNPAVTGQTNGTITETLHNNIATPVIVSYEIVPSANGCAGDPFIYTVTVNPTPTVSSSSSATVCNGKPQNYTITGGSSNTTFNWSRVQVPGVSNTAVTGRISNIITETLHNITTSPVTVSYEIIPRTNGCTGDPFIYNVTVNPTPTVTSSSSATICSNAQQNYTITGGVANTTFAWSRAQVPGISNAAVAGQASDSITETLHNTTASPVTVSYEIIPAANGCTGDPFIYKVTVNPTPAITNTDLVKTICSGETLPMVLLTSDVPGTNFTWTATATTGITGFISNGNGDIPVQSIKNMASVPGVLTYSITPFHDGCQGVTTNLVVTVNPIPATPVVTSNSPLCVGSVLRLSTPTVAGASYSWSGPEGFVSNEQNPGLPNISLAAGGTYSVQTIVNGCTSNAGTTEVTVVPLPATPTPSSNSPICEGSTLILSTSSITGATYNWTGPNGFSSSLQNPAINSAPSTASGIYFLTVTVNGCPSASGTTEVVVNPIPLAPVAGSNSPLCAGSNVNLSAESISGATYNWTGPNGFSSILQNPVITSVSLADAGTYYVTTTVAGCTGPAQPVTVEINTTPIDPEVTATSPVCAGGTVYLEATEFAGALYSWTGPAGFISNLRNPVINNADPGINGTYTVVISSPGCGINITKDIFVKVNDIPTAPIVTNNGPVCEGGTISLSASAVPGASYSWTGPNGFISSLQDPDIPNATMLNAGTYRLFITVDGCVSPVSETIVTISEASVVNTGPDQTVCSASPLVALDGNISGGSSTGVWSTSGTGTFPQGNTSLKGVYSPSQADISSGSIRLTLTSTNNKCDAVVSSFVVTIQQAPVVAAGPDQEVCSDKPHVKLNGNVTAQYGAVWSSSGTGRFTPSNSDLNATYIPGREDISTGNVTLRLSSTGNGTCSVVLDELNISIVRPPVIAPLADTYIFEDESLILEPQVSGEKLEYTWTPSDYLSDPVIRNPSVKGVEDIIYTLTVKGKAGCVETSQISIKVLKPIKIPNTFTPNNDGVNDVWNIRELNDYPGVLVSIFNRYGSKLFSSPGYDSPWDGTHNGKPVPTGVYYYVIDIPIYNKTLSGYITVIK